MYNPTKAERTSLNDFYDDFQTFSAKCTKVVIGGDFNVNLLENTSSVNHHKSQIASMGLAFVNTTSPTHFQETPTLLDHFLVSDPSLILQYQQLSAPAYSKHDLIHLSFSFSSSKSNVSTYSYRNFKAIDDEKLQSEIESINWEHFLDLHLDNCVQLMKREINRLFEEHVANSNWKQHRLTATCDVHRQSFILIRSLVTSKIRAAKTEYFGRKLDPRQPTKTLWKQLRSCGVTGKPQHSCESDPNTLINSFFPSTQAPQFDVSLVPPRPSPSFVFHTVSPADVVFAFRSLKSNAVGLDGVSLKFIKRILPAIINFITDVYNRCLTESYFPSSWKMESDSSPEKR